jgi:hypothetical protein
MQVQAYLLELIKDGHTMWQLRKIKFLMLSISISWAQASVYRR